MKNWTVKWLYQGVWRTENMRMWDTIDEFVKEHLDGDYWQLLVRTDDIVILNPNNIGPTSVWGPMIAWRR